MKYELKYVLVPGERDNVGQVIYFMEHLSVDEMSFQALLQF